MLSRSSVVQCFIFFISFNIMGVHAQTGAGPSVSGPASVSSGSRFTLTLENPDPASPFTSKELQIRAPVEADFSTITTLDASISTYELSIDAPGEHEFRLRFLGTVHDFQIFTDWGNVHVVDIKGEEVLSVNSLGEQGDDDSFFPAISPDGLTAAFVTTALNLDPSVTPPPVSDNRYVHIGVRDRINNRTFYANENSDGSFHQAESVQPAFSPDGRFLVYMSRDGVTMRDLITKDFSILTPGLNVREFEYSDDGRYLAMLDEGISFYDFQTGRAFDILPPGFDGNRIPRNALMDNVSVSSNGRFVVFETNASNVVPGDTAERTMDVFLLDRATNRYTLISRSYTSLTPTGGRFPQMSADGSKIVFSSSSSNIVLGDNNGLADVFMFDRTTLEMTRITNDGGTEPTMDAEGRRISYLNNGDHFVYDRATQNRSFVVNGLSAVTALARPAMSRDGRFLLTQKGSFSGDQIVLGAIPQ
ncbi:hypothetical protein FKG94_01380 [Exilibacterium tricleocarpae]|uniref:Uncharacterized protein n=1 Tax=Exilibacterium tricleocarpae TaxID=2591008 RepID=A0A545U9U5_9GAMM|nr:PD40 domain-containing protein [Exilibacterium tricleocarpae]TQV86231.1 hypothetical protein FKG94_01380 [Exilibacterium tricleocarpae]